MAVFPVTMARPAIPTGRETGTLTLDELDLSSRAPGREVRGVLADARAARPVVGDAGGGQRLSGRHG